MTKRKKMVSGEGCLGTSSVSFSGASLGMSGVFGSRGSSTSGLPGCRGDSCGSLGMVWCSLLTTCCLQKQRSPSTICFNLANIQALTAIISEKTSMHKKGQESPGTCRVTARLFAQQFFGAAQCLRAATFDQ